MSASREALRASATEKEISLKLIAQRAGNDDAGAPAASATLASNKDDEMDAKSELELEKPSCESAAAPM